MDTSAICVFSGLGGGSIGLESAGFHVVLAVDNCPDAKEAHEAFSPGVPVDTSDLTQVPIAEVLIKHGIDPLTFGGIILCSPPCPGFANCGKRDPEAKTNDLLRIPSHLSHECPSAWIVVENVRGLLALRNRPRLLELLNSFKADGRNVPTVEELRNNWVLDAQFYGAPQHRERVFIVAPPKNCGQLCVPPQTTPNGLTLGQVIGPESGFVDPDPRAILLRATEAACFFQPENPWVKKYRARHGKPMRTQSFDRPCATIIAYVKNGGTGRVSLIHPKEARLLSIGERMAAFGFPIDRGPIPAGLIAAHRLIGNAIVPPVIESIALQIKKSVLAAESDAV